MAHNMKMPQAMYEDLKRDFYLVCDAIAKHKGPFTPTLGIAWRIVARVEQERQYTGDLRTQLEALTGVPCTVEPVEGYRMGPWYTGGLDDAHLTTALKRILQA